MSEKSPGRRFYVVIYDVTDDGRRRRLAKYLRRYGTRVQKSGFQLWLDRGELPHIMQRAKRLVNEDVDRVHFYPLCATCRGLARFVGRGRIIQPQGDVVV
jgi:CRISPR-associated protein Cas2